MNKKLLLLALPTLMVLSGCGQLNNKVAPKEENLIREDNLAHEELFGEVEQLLPKKLGDPVGDEPGSDPSWTKMPKIGIQYHAYQKDTNPDPEIEELQNFFAVRYVAAIEGLDDGVTASWTRAVSDKTSTKVKDVEGGHNSVVAYDSLNNGGSQVLATSEGTGYNKYVVYTMYDIPEAQADSYIVAYLTLSKEAQDPVRSKAVAARIAGDHAFSFAPNKSSGYFMAGTLLGDANSIMDLGPGSSDNKAELLGQELFAGDTFGYFLIANENDGYLSSFQYYGWDTFKDNQYYLERDGGSDLFKVRVHGTYDIYVNKDFKLWFNCESASVDLYFVPNSDWLAADAILAVYFIDNTAFNELVEVDAVNHIYKLADFDFVAHPSLIFTRHNPDGFVSFNWENKWNQTVDLTYPTDNPAKSLFTITSGGGNTYNGEWSIKA